MRVHATVSSTAWRQVHACTHAYIPAYIDTSIDTYIYTYVWTDGMTAQPIGVELSDPSGKLEGKARSSLFAETGYFG